MKVIIDNHAGPCPGVTRALKTVEETLEQKNTLISLGPVIHNDRELIRLSDKGLIVEAQETVEAGNIPESFFNNTVFIRSHGVSPRVENLLRDAKVDLIDGTCGIVKRVHRVVQDHFKLNYQIVITGKDGHAEVKGIMGYCDDNGIVVGNIDDLDKVDPDKKTLLVSQTTFDPEKFLEIQDRLELLVKKIKVKDTTCKHIKRKNERLQSFAKSVDVCLMVGGKQSSNTGILFDLIKKNNPNSYRIEGPDDLENSWFKDSDTIGVTGSASTPVWQLEKVAHALEKLPEKGL